MDCPFCFKRSQLVLFESEYTYVLANKFPATESHLLVVPKIHVSNISELSAEQLSDMMKCIQESRKKINRFSSPVGYNIILNEGLIAEQSIDHLHWHIIPRYHGDGCTPFKRCPGIKEGIRENGLRALKLIFRE